jgi:hypothetical protein
MDRLSNEFADLARVSAEEMPDFVERTDELGAGAFPKFLNFSPMVVNHWADLYRLFRAYQFALAEPNTGKLVSFANCFPLRWDSPLDDLPEGGLEWALPEAVRQAEAGMKPNLLCAFQIVVHPTLLNHGLSYRTVTTMIETARTAGLSCLIAPVRPNRKERYPAMPFEEYIAWKREDGLPVDDWVRVHVRLGGRIIRPCHRAMLVTGSFEDWKHWTGVDFDRPGEQFVPRGLVPLQVDPITRTAAYIEPNLWIAHRVK